MTPPSKDITAPAQVEPIASVVDDKGVFFSVERKVRDETIERIGTVYFREMGGEARDLWDKFVVDRLPKDKDGAPANGIPDNKGARAFLVVQCVVRPDGVTPLFTMGDRDKLQQMPGKILDSMFRVIQEMNGLGEDGAKKTEGN